MVQMGTDIIGRAIVKAKLVKRSQRKKCELIEIALHASHYSPAILGRNGISNNGTELDQKTRQKSPVSDICG